MPVHGKMLPTTYSGTLQVLFPPSSMTGYHGLGSSATSEEHLGCHIPYGVSAHLLRSRYSHQVLFPE